MRMLNNTYPKLKEKQNMKNNEINVKELEKVNGGVSDTQYPVSCPGRKMPDRPNVPMPVSGQPQTDELFPYGPHGSGNGKNDKFEKIETI